MDNVWREYEAVGCKRVFRKEEAEIVIMDPLVKFHIPGNADKLDGSYFNKLDVMKWGMMIHNIYEMLSGVKEGSRPIVREFLNHEEAKWFLKEIFGYDMRDKERFYKIYNR